MQMKSYRIRFAKRSKYQRLNNGSKNRKKSWRVKRLRWRTISPTNLWTNFKNAYIAWMSNMAQKVGSLTNGTAFPIVNHPVRARFCSRDEYFYDRLIYEIYKNFIASRELATI
ncbi:hypothetical protein R6Q59_034589 [Mikania micrantha]